MKTTLDTLLVAALILAMGAGADLQPTDKTPQAQRRGAKPPNTVFFLVDDAGCYGSSFYETHHIDRFARDGVRFTQAYAACHVCSPTRAVF